MTQKKVDLKGGLAAFSLKSLYWFTGQEPADEFRPTRRNVKFELKKQEKQKTRKRDVRR